MGWLTGKQFAPSSGLERETPASGGMGEEWWRYTQHPPQAYMRSHGQTLPHTIHVGIYYRVLKNMAQTHLPRDGTHSGLGHPTSITLIKIISHRHDHRLI